MTTETLAALNKLHQELCLYGYDTDVKVKRLRTTLEQEGVRDTLLEAMMAVYADGMKAKWEPRLAAAAREFVTFWLENEDMQDEDD